MTQKARRTKSHTPIVAEPGELIVERDGEIIHGFDPDRPDESPEPPQPANR